MQQTDEDVRALTDMVRGAIAKSPIPFTPAQKTAALFQGVGALMKAGARLKDGKMWMPNDSKD